jgi:hypothetical protein
MGFSTVAAMEVVKMKDENINNLWMEEGFGIKTQIST